LSGGPYPERTDCLSFEGLFFFMSSDKQDVPGVVVFPPILWGGALAVGLVLHWIWPIHPFRSLTARLLGAGLFIVSLAVAVWAERTMQRAGTEIRPDRPTSAIVTDGPFRYSRNPVYIASAGLTAAISLLLNALAPILLLIPVMFVIRYGVVAREERYLDAKFGEVYRAYRGRVRRWL
jgi:protein-S-isoprenylcysteine O-methyltransferase Ste14